MTLDVDGDERTRGATPSSAAGRVEVEFNRIDEVDEDDMVDFDGRR